MVAWPEGGHRDEHRTLRSSALYGWTPLCWVRLEVRGLFSMFWGPWGLGSACLWNSQTLFQSMNLSQPCGVILIMFLFCQRLAIAHKF